MRTAIVSSAEVGVLLAGDQVAPSGEVSQVELLFQLPEVTLRYLSGGLTVIFAEALFPVPPLVDVTVLVVLVSVPVAAPFAITTTVILQSPAKGPSEPPVIVRVVKVLVTLPPLQIGSGPDVPLNSSPVGRVSLNEMPVSVVLEFGFVTDKVMNVEPPTLIGDVAKSFCIEGGEIPMPIAKKLNEEMAFEVMVVPRTPPPIES